MAEIVANIFFRNNRTYGAGILTFDLILSENHNFSNTITQYVIEDGSNISDHILNEPFSGSLSGLVTNFSLTQNGITTNRAQESFDIMETLWRRKELIDVQTIYKVYKNVLISNFSTSRDNDSGESIIIDISFQEVSIKKLQEIVIEASIKLRDMNNNTNRQASKKRDTGKNISNIVNPTTNQQGFTRSGIF